MTCQRQRLRSFIRVLCFSLGLYPLRLRTIFQVLGVNDPLHTPHTIPMDIILCPNKADPCGPRDCSLHFRWHVRWNDSLGSSGTPDSRHAGR